MEIYDFMTKMYENSSEQLNIQQCTNRNIIM